jgi:hypothetical protein
MKNKNYKINPFRIEKAKNSVYLCRVHNRTHR